MISHAILTHNRGGSRAHPPAADGIVVTPSHNPPGDGGFKYNPPHGGPADTDVTGWIEREANRLLEQGLDGVPRVPFDEADGRPRRDYVSAYVDDLPSVIDLDAIRARGHPARRRPARRRERRLLAGDPRAPRARPGDRQRRGRPDVPLRPARLGRQDPHGLLVAARDGAAARAGRPLRRRVRQRPGRRPPRHRHAVRRAAEPEPPPRRLHRLPVRRPPRLGRRTSAIGKTLVSSSIIDRVAADLGRRLVEVPVGLQVVRRRAARRARSGSAARRAPARRSCAATARAWSTDKDGLIPCLLAAEMKATTGKDPGELYAGLAERFGRAAYRRTDVAASAGGEGRAQAALARAGARATSWPASRSRRC